MKLYYVPGACSLAPHIVACELGIKLELIKVDTKNKTTSSGRNYLEITPKGYVPALELDDGRLLTEGPAISQYLADMHPEKKLAAKCGTFERAKQQEWLTYVGTELHQAFGPLFNPASTDAEKQAATDKLKRRLAVVETALTKGHYLVSDCFSVADAYLFTVLCWCGYVNFDLSPFPSVQRYIKELAQRESIIAAQTAEKNG